MLRFLLPFSILSFFVLQSCKTFELSGVEPLNSEKATVDNLYFDDAQTDYVYKSQIEVYGNLLSGILILKKINNSTHRIALTSDFGNKMMDFEITDNSFKINYIISDLDKKMVINLLEKDFRLLLKKQYPITESFQNSASEIYQSVQGKKNYYLFFNKQNNLLSQIIFTEGQKAKINFNYVAKTPILADEIELIHHDIKLKIKLLRINN